MQNSNENTVATTVSTSNGVNLQFFNAVGNRQPKSVNEDVVIAESTRASFKLMPSIAAKLGIQDGDYVTMQITKDENGVANGVYIGKGKNAVYALNENGEAILDERNRKVIDVPGFGALAAEQTPGTNVLKMSTASAWDVVGNTEVKKHYTLGDPIHVAQLPIGNGQFISTTLYKLEFLKDEEKVVRTSKAKTEEVSEEKSAESNDVASDFDTTADDSSSTTPSEAFDAPTTEGYDANNEF